MKSEPKVPGSAARSENTSTSAPAVKETPVSSEDSTLTTSIPTFPRRAALKEDERSVGDLPRVSTSGGAHRLPVTPPSRDAFNRNEGGSGRSYQDNFGINNRSEDDSTLTVPRVFEDDERESGLDVPDFMR